MSSSAPLLLALCVAAAGPDEERPADAPAAETGPEAAQEAAEAEEAGDEGPSFEVIGLPLYVQSPDAGPTLLGAGSFYLHDGKTKPYKLWVGGTVSASLFGVLSGIGYAEWVRPFDTPLRLLVTAGYQSTLAAHYCGRHGACDAGVAERAGLSLGLNGLDLEEFARRYERYAFHGPVGSARLRWAVRDLPHRIEAVLGVNAAYYIPGTFGFGGLQAGPYPASRYARVFPEGEPGLLNVVEAGIMADNRDHEGQPSRGYWIESSLRTASVLTLSNWNFGGFNATARGYLPLRKDGSLVLAERAIVDVLVGDPPTYEMQRIGGTWNLQAYGGLHLGRGIREARMLGRIKLITQTELRARIFQTEIFGVGIDLGVVGFVDGGLIAFDVADLLGGGLSNLHGSFGTGLRLRIMENLLFRVELGFAPAEAWQPQLYVWPAFPF